MHHLPSTSTNDLPVELKEIHKRYKGGAWANRGITLSARPGETLGILGPNGAGKTTLVRQITTELLPTSGEARVFGHNVIERPSVVKKLMGVLPQEANPFYYVTAYQHLRIFAKLRGLTPTAARVRADELIDELRLTEHRDVAAHKLSGGLKRKLLVGIAAVARPPLLVLDEPTTGLDPQSRRDFWSLLGRYKEKGTTVLLTTHYMEEAEELCDRVGIIQGGRLLALDTVDNLRAAHGYEFKITYGSNGAGRQPKALYCADDRELVERVRAIGAEQYAVARTSLEDVYMALTDGEEALDGDSG